MIIRTPGPLSVELDGYILSMMNLMHQVLGYFKWIFEDGDIAFPLELQNQLELRRIGEPSRSENVGKT
jgi:hypothetical protein